MVSNPIILDNYLVFCVSFSTAIYPWLCLVPLLLFHQAVRATALSLTSLPEWISFHFWEKYYSTYEKRRQTWRMWNRFGCKNEKAQNPQNQPCSECWPLSCYNRNDLVRLTVLIYHHVTLQLFPYTLPSSLNNNEITKNDKLMQYLCCSNKNSHTFALIRLMWQIKILMFNTAVRLHQTH